MTSRGSAVERSTLEGLKVVVPKSVEDMFMDVCEKAGGEVKVGCVAIRTWKVWVLRMQGKWEGEEKEEEEEEE